MKPPAKTQEPRAFSVAPGYAPSSDEILAWIDANPEGFTRTVVRKSWGRKVWWQAPNGNNYDTLRKCVASALHTLHNVKVSQPHGNNL